MPSADPLSVELGDGRMGTVRIEWDADGLRGLDDAEAGGEPPWRIHGEPDWGAVAELRIVSAAFEEGGLLALAAMRPAEATGHDADATAAIVVEPGQNDRVEVERPLVSTEYDPTGAIARIGIELETEPGTTPLRVSAERSEAVRGAEDGRTAMEFKMQGKRGSGALEVVGPA
jgi:hypothetical protein